MTRPQYSRQGSKGSGAYPPRNDGVGYSKSCKIIKAVDNNQYGIRASKVDVDQVCGGNGCCCDEINQASKLANQRHKPVQLGLSSSSEQRYPRRS